MADRPSVYMVLAGHHWLHSATCPAEPCPQLHGSKQETLPCSVTHGDRVPLCEPVRCLDSGVPAAQELKVTTTSLAMQMTPVLPAASARRRPPNSVPQTPVLVTVKTLTVRQSSAVLTLLILTAHQKDLDRTAAYTLSLLAQPVAPVEPEDRRGGNDRLGDDQLPVHLALNLITLSSHRTSGSADSVEPALSIRTTSSSSAMLGAFRSFVNPSSEVPHCNTGVFSRQSARRCTVRTMSKLRDSAKQGLLSRRYFHAD